MDFKHTYTSLQAHAVKYSISTNTPALEITFIWHIESQEHHYILAAHYCRDV